MFRTERKKAGKTVKDVCAHIGVTAAAVYFWETGQTRPSVPRLPKLAAFYGCTVDDLLREEPDAETQTDAQ